MYGLKQAVVLAYKHLVKNFLLMVMSLANNLQDSGNMQQRIVFFSALMIFI